MIKLKLALAATLILALCKTWQCWYFSLRCNPRASWPNCKIVQRIFGPCWIL